MFPTLIVLAISTILNTIYFLKTVIRIYTPEKEEVERRHAFFHVSWKKQKIYTVAIILFILVNLMLGMMADPIIEIIQTGLANFA